MNVWQRKGFVILTSSLLSRGDLKILIRVLFTVDEADGCAKGPDRSDREVWRAAASRSSPPPRLRSQCCSSRYQTSCCGVCQPQGVGGKCCQCRDFRLVLIVTFSSDERWERRSSNKVHQTDCLINIEEPSHLLLSWQIVSVSSNHQTPRMIIMTSYHFRRLRAYESHLSTVALSNVESSRTVSQILFEMANATEIVWICQSLLIFSWNVSVDCDLIYFYTKKHYTWPRRIVNQEHPQISNCRVNECDYLFSVCKKYYRD